MEGLELLNSECFTYDNYESNWWSLFDLNFMQSLNRNTIRKCIKDFAVGYCEGGRITIRPNPDSYAVMFEKDGERFWFHIEKWEMERTNHE
jgi:hypothetical protein